MLQSLFQSHYCLDHNGGSVLQGCEDVKLRYKVELESYLFSQSYLAKVVSQAKVKMNFKKEGGCVSPIYDQIFWKLSVNLSTS